MKLFYLTPFFAAATLIVSSCANEETEEEWLRPVPIELTRSESNACEAVNEFSFDVLKATDNSVKSENPNYVFSPQTYAWTLAMIANATMNKSDEQKEIINALHLGDDTDIDDLNNYTSKLIAALVSSDKYSKLSVSNAVFHGNDISLKKGYLDILNSFYNVKEFAGHTNDAIDSWISSNTSGRINDFAKTFNLERFNWGVISNLSFEGVWYTSFEPKETADGEFRNADGTVSIVRMMSKKIIPRRCINHDLCSLATLEFRGGMFGITFVIPSEGTTIDDFISGLNSEKWEEIYNYPYGPYSVLIKIPKLDLRSDIDFTKITKELGMANVMDRFDVLTTASDDPICFDTAAQSTCLKLDETGVKAESASVGGGHPGSAGYGYFYLDEPFIFMINEMTTGAILFMGKVSQL